eukprot:4638725-Amphidinium_carterae.1
MQTAIGSTCEVNNAYVWHGILANLIMWLDALSMESASNFTTQWARTPPEIRELGSEDDFFTIIAEHVSNIKSGKAFVLELPNEITNEISAAIRLLLAPRPCIRSFWQCDANGDVVGGPNACPLVTAPGTGPEDPQQRLYQVQEWVWHPDLPQPLLVRAHGSPTIGGILGDGDLATAGLPTPFMANSSPTSGGEPKG